MYVFMENQERYWKSLLDLALIDLPRASNIDRNFFTNGIRSRGTFLSNTASFFLFSNNSMATFVRTKARPE